mgnify:CR=1 FL=1
MSRLDELIEKLCPDGVEYKELGEVARYAKTRIAASKMNENNYVGVENLLQEKRGKTTASSVPAFGTVIAFERGDILIGNIRPYLKKIWLADCEGGTNGDVLTVQINDRSLFIPEYLYYVLSSDKFFLSGSADRNSPHSGQLYGAGEGAGEGAGASQEAI